MTRRKAASVGILSFLACLLAIGWAAAQDATPPAKPDSHDAVGDDFRPFPPQTMPKDRGPRNFDRPGQTPREGGPGKDPFDRPGKPDTFRPGGPHGGMGGPLVAGQAGTFGQPPMPGQPGMFGQPGMPGQGAMPGQPGVFGQPPMPGQGGMFSQPGMLGQPPRWPHADWHSLERNDPEMWKLLQADYDLNRRSQELAVQHRQAPKDQQEAIQQQLEKTVVEHFETRQERRLLELKRLEEELKRLRDSIDKRKKAQPEIVNRRVSELLGLKDEPQF